MNRDEKEPSHAFGTPPVGVPLASERLPVCALGRLSAVAQPPARRHPPAEGREGVAEADEEVTGVGASEPEHSASTLGPKLTRDDRLVTLEDSVLLIEERVGTLAVPPSSKPTMPGPAKLTLDALCGRE
jgi:hypothetical protein